MSKIMEVLLPSPLHQQSRTMAQRESSCGRHHGPREHDAGAGCNLWTAEQAVLERDSDEDAPVVVQIAEDEAAPSAKLSWRERAVQLRKAREMQVQ